MRSQPDDPRPTGIPGRRPLPPLDDVHPWPGETDELLVAAGRGDLDAFVAFFDWTSPAVFGLLSGVLERSTEAEWATEVAYLQLWRTAAGFDPLDGSAWSRVLLAARRVLTGPVYERIMADPVQVTPGDLMDRPDSSTTGPERPLPDPRGDIR